MSYKDIENRYSATMAQILSQRLTDEEKATADYNQKKTTATDELNSNMSIANSMLSVALRDYTNEKIFLIEKKSNGTPAEVLEAEKRLITVKCDYENKTSKIKLDRQKAMNKYLMLKDSLREEYNNAINAIRYEANSKIQQAKQIFNHETEEYRQQKQEQQSSRVVESVNSAIYSLTSNI